MSLFVECAWCGCCPLPVGPGEPCSRCGRTDLHYHCKRAHILCDRGCTPKGG